MTGLELRYAVHGDLVYVDFFEFVGAVEGLTPRARLQSCGPLNRVNDFSQSLRKTYAELLKLLLSASPRHGAVELGREMVRRLQPLGASLANLLLPEELSRAIADLPVGAPLLVEFDPRLAGVPWECLFFQGDYLAFRYGIVRRIVASGPHAVRPSHGLTPQLRVGSIFDPGSQFDPAPSSSYDEFLTNWRLSSPARRLEFPTDATLLGGTVEPEAVRQLLRQSEILVLYAHHDSGVTDPNAASGGRGLRLAADRYFSANDLRQAFRPGDSVPELIASIACHSAGSEGWESTWLEEGRVHGFVDAALRVGVPYYLATLFDVAASNAANILPPLFQAIDEGRTVAEAVRLARVALRGLAAQDPWNPGAFLGLSFALFGNGTGLRPLLSPGAGRIGEGHPFRLCTHLEEGQECGRGIRETETGFTGHRCARHFQGGETRRYCAAGHEAPASAMVRCTACDCESLICPSCRGYAARRCFSHISWQGVPFDDPAAAVACRDPYQLHPGEIRWVAWSEGTAYRKALCGECLRKWGAERQTGP